MKTTEIYIICTREAGGRYVQTATTDRNRADVEAARLLGNYAAAGWNVEQRQIIPLAEQFEPVAPGVPAVIEVYHLKRRPGEWENVELYRVEEMPNE